MKERTTGGARVRVLATLTLSAILLTASGCQKSEPESPEAATPETASNGSDLQGPAPAQLTADSPAPIPPSTETPEAILEGMLKAYREATSYADVGELRIEGTAQGQAIERVTPCSVMAERPNKFSMKVDLGLITCDGTTLWAQAEDLLAQALHLPAPEELSIRALYPDTILASRMLESAAQTRAWVPLQAVLLLSPDPLRTLLDGVEEIELLSPERIETHVCDRVQGSGPDGNRVLWIDRATHALRRLEFPRSYVEGEPQADVNVRLTAEYQDATFGPELPFAFEPFYPNTIFVEELTPTGYELLGKPAGELGFEDLDGNPIDVESLTGKVLVVNFWSTKSSECREILPVLAQLHNQYRENDQVAFLAVSLDDPNVESQTLQTVLDGWQVDLPTYRVTNDSTFQQFSLTPLTPLPTTVLLDAERIVQDHFATGALADPQDLATRIETLLGGNDLHPVLASQFEASKAGFNQLLERCVAADLYTLAAGADVEFPTAEIGERTEPSSMKLTQLWQCSDLIQPGNILVIPQEGDTPRILVVNEFSRVAELGTDGQVLANHTIEKLPDDAITLIRTSTGPEGKRYFVASTMFAQQVHLLDENFQPLMAYPEDAVENPHAGIGDVRLADLDGDGTPELIIGYFDVTGLHCVSLEGERRWANRSIVNIFQIGVLAPDPQGQTSLLALDAAPEGGSLAVISPEGTRLQHGAASQAVIWIAADDVDGDGRSEICTLSQVPDRIQVDGLAWQGSEAWSYELPLGMHQQPIEAIKKGNLLGKPAGQWLIASADSTIHILDKAGNPVDRFTYGKELSGMATAQWADKNVLLIATPEAITAYQVETP